MVISMGDGMLSSTGEFKTFVLTGLSVMEKFLFVKGGEKVYAAGRI